ncbi:uncharacterized protein [Littorina saxatilis]|uniref:Uncharacterized protein n=1 Tax=Littorina saxatilis TaxID=31220 RepID=A0AAN9ARQ6_9CAEN
MPVRGKRSCSLCISFGLHVVGLAALVAGMCSPYWSRVYDETSGAVTVYNGLFVSLDPQGNFTLTDFNQFKDAGRNDTQLYGVLALSFGIGSMFLQFFLVQAYGFAFYNASCGKAYNPDWLMIFSLLSGFVCITCLVLYEQFLGRNLKQLASTNVIKMDYSRGFVIIFIALAFVAAFFTVCDRTNNPKDDNGDSFGKKKKGKR